MTTPNLEKLAYSIPNFAEAVDYSITTIYDEIKAGRITPSYANRKPVIPREEGMRWLSTLPAEPPTSRGVA